MTTIALLTTALLFGGMTLFSFGFAAFLFTSLPAETASPLIRKAFPHFYLCVRLSGAHFSQTVSRNAALASFHGKRLPSGVFSSRPEEPDRRYFREH